MSHFVATLVLLTPRPASADEAPPRLVVLELANPARRPVQEVAYLTDRVRAAALAHLSGRWHVLTRENLVEAVAPGTDLAACERGCEVETARRVGAHAVISGELVAFGGELRLALKLHETRGGALLATDKAAAADVVALEAIVEAAATRLVGSLGPDKPPAAPASIDRLRDARTGHAAEVDAAWRAARAVAVAGGPAGRAALRNFLARYADHPLGNARATEAETLHLHLDPVEWVVVEGGRFEMGSDDVEAEGPRRKIRVAKYRIGRAEITVEQYGWCVEAGACTPPATDEGCNWDQPDRGGHPVNCVTWAQARRYAEWIGARLPSEAEWEYAARSRGRAWQYPWGNGRATCAHAVMGAACGEAGTAAVCTRPDGRSKQSVCDLAGNVAEWVADWYGPDLSDLPVDGTARTQAKHAARSVRGGHHADDAWGQRATRRAGHPPDGWYSPNVGFRAAR